MISKGLYNLKKSVEKMQREANKVAPVLSRDDEGMLLCDSKPVFPFKLRPYQKIDFDEFFGSKQPKFYLKYPRRAGKDSFCWMIVLTSALSVPGIYVYVLPDKEHAKKVIWFGAMIDKFTKKANMFMDMIPKGLIASKNAQEKIITLTNGSVIYLVGANRPASLRGINLTGIVFSEFAFYATNEAYKIVLPVITEAKGWILINTTPNGFNYAWSLFESLVNDKDWYIRRETVETLVDENGIRYISDDDVARAVKDGNYSKGFTRQEFYCEELVESDELYYSLEMSQMMEDGRICTVKPNPSLPIHFAFDLGNDATPVIGFQVEISGNILIPFYHEPTKDVKTYDFYWTKIKEYCNSKHLNLGKIILPHDSVKRTPGESDITSPMKIFQNFGASVLVLPRVGNKDSLINLSKVYLPKTKIDKDLEYLIRSLRSYNRIYDNKTETFMAKPRHDWACHSADAYQYVCHAIEDGYLSLNKQREIYY